MVNPGDYDDVTAALGAGGFTLAQRKQLAAKAFRHTADYDVAVASWMSSVVAPSEDGSVFPEWAGASWERKDVLRYGENPHQAAALYQSVHASSGLATAEQLHGKQMSFQQLHRRRCRLAQRPRLRRSGGGDHQARQPVWHCRRRRYR